MVSVAIDQKRVLSGHAAESQQTEIAVVTDARSEQHEGIDATAVDRQLLDLERSDDGRDIGLGVLD